MLPHVTFGKPGALSWKPFNHIAQLSVAKDHSPTSTGNVLACGDDVEGDWHGADPLWELLGHPSITHLHRANALAPRARIIKETLLRLDVEPCLVDMRVDRNARAPFHEPRPRLQTKRVLSSEHKRTFSGELLGRASLVS